MPEKVRQANARAAAAKYAPGPNGSTLTYGLIAVSILAVALAIYGGFCEVDMLSQPLALALAGIASFCVGVAFRLRRQRRHAKAYEAEYAVRQHALTAAANASAPQTDTEIGQ